MRWRNGSLIGPQPSAAPPVSRLSRRCRTLQRVQRNLQEIGPSIRRPPYLLERMFPRFREQLGTALDLIVEFSTLGEYRLGVDSAHGAPGAPAVAPGHAPQLGGAGSPAG